MSPFYGLREQGCSIRVPCLQQLHLLLHKKTVSRSKNSQAQIKSVCLNFTSVIKKNLEEPKCRDNVSKGEVQSLSPERALKPEHPQ